MTFNEWADDQLRLVEETLPPSVKKLKGVLEKKFKNTPLVVSSDAGKIAVLTPDYKYLFTVGSKGGKFEVEKDKKTTKLNTAKEVIKHIDSVATGDFVF